MCYVCIYTLTGFQYIFDNSVNAHQIVRIKINGWHFGQFFKFSEILSESLSMAPSGQTALNELVHGG